MLPRFSVVTPSYNQAAYLEQTILSVLDQGYPDLEYIIVDGGSSDGSLEIIQKYQKHLSWWVSERDHGQADAVNKGFARCTGELVGWVNSDDLFEPGALLDAAQVMQANPQYGIVYGDVRSIDSAGKMFNLMRFGDYGLAGLMCFDIIGQPGAFLRRSVLQQSGYLDVSYNLLLDHELWLRMAQAAPIHYVPRVWAAGRFHSGAKNTAQAAHYGADAYRIIAWMQTQPGLAAEFKRLQSRIWAGAHRLNARYLLDAGLTRAALKFYAKSLAAHPPTALREWHRMLYGLLSLAGLGGLRSVYLNWRRRKYEQRS
jgi:glycosyltransferase involved in cell wall biosynthesis